MCYSGLPRFSVLGDLVIFITGGILMLTFYGKVVDRVLGILLVALFSSLLLLSGSLYVRVDDQVRKDEYTLAVGTRLQQQTFYVFDRGAVYGYQLAYKQLIPTIGDLIHQAITHHDEILAFKAKQHKHHKIHDR